MDLAENAKKMYKEQQDRINTDIKVINQTEDRNPANKITNL